MPISRVHTHIYVVPIMRVTQVTMLTVRSHGILTHKSYCSLLLYANNCALLRSFTTRRVSELFDRTLYCGKKNPFSFARNASHRYVCSDSPLFLPIVPTAHRAVPSPSLWHRPKWQHRREHSQQLP